MEKVNNYLKRIFFAVAILPIIAVFFKAKIALFRFCKYLE